MKNKRQTLFRRRDLLRTVIAGAAAGTAMNTVLVEASVAEPRNSSDKRKARYHANSVEVQEFYRVNRYPAR
jgi:hypothetical protein